MHVDNYVYFSALQHITPISSGMAPHPPPHRAKILTLPLEVTTELMRQLYRNEVIELSDIGSLGRLQDVAANQTSLAVFKVGFLDDDLVARLMM
jgi:hypothetical protein